MSQEPGMPGVAAPWVRVPTKSEASYQHLRQLILNGTLEPGSTLNQEALAAELDISITPLREALRRLGVEGFVKLEAHRTVAIATLTRRELSELYVVRLQLDPLAAALTAEHADDDRLREISRLANRRTERDPAVQFRKNREFHRSIYSACGNSVLIQVLEQLWDRTDRYRWLVLQQGRLRGAVGSEHREIARALAARDATRAASLVRAHVEKTALLIGERLPDALD